MRTWVATLDELQRDEVAMMKAHTLCGRVVTDYRVAYEDAEGLKIITPDARFVAALMDGGHFRFKRRIDDCPVTGRPIFEGTDELMPAMTELEAVTFTAWFTMPAGLNAEPALLTTAELPASRVFRNAWRLTDG